MLSQLKRNEVSKVDRVNEFGWRGRVLWSSKYDRGSLRSKRFCVSLSRKLEQRGRGQKQALAQKTHYSENAPWWLGLFVDRQLVNIYSFLSFLNILYMITEAYNGTCSFVI